MKVNIRDDDTCFFTSSSELQLAYGDFLGGVPITLAITPFVSKHSLIMETLPGDRPQQFAALNSIESRMSAKELADLNRVYPIGDNVELTESLQRFVESRSVEIALHGVTHRFYPDGAEFSPNHVNSYNVRDSKWYLERLFKTDINYFVPPSNKIDFTGLSILKDLDLSLLTSGMVDYNGPSEFLKLYLKTMLKNPLKLKSFIRKSFPLVHSNLDGVECIRSKTFGLNDDYDSFMRKLESSFDQFDFLSIATHYTTLRDDPLYRQRFHHLLNKLSSDRSVEFARVDDYFKKRN